jgi:phage repressor protein C with HTH and peptisase S24 domain
MLTHPQIWMALDRLAARAGLTSSGLAKKAGLDPTTFNKSKRTTPDGRPRWPSTESVAKSLAATSTSITTFAQLTSDEARPATQIVPLLKFEEALTGNNFDDGGRPTGSGWVPMPFPTVSDETMYALAISGAAMEPAYRDGSILLVSPAAMIRTGDRIVTKTRTGEVMLKELKHRSGKSIELKAIASSEADRTLPSDDMAWMARVIWVSQ